MTGDFFYRKTNRLDVICQIEKSSSILWTVRARFCWGDVGNPNRNHRIRKEEILGIKIPHQ